MKSILCTCSLSVLLLMFLISTAAVAQVERRRSPSGAVAAAGEVAGAQRASCVLQIDFDANRGNRGMDIQTLNALLTSTAIVDPAAEKALGLKPDDWPKVAQVELLPAGQVAV